MQSILFYVIVFIENSEGKFLIQKTSKEKGSVWATTGGLVSSGYTSDETIVKEIEEELDNLMNISNNLFDSVSELIYIVKNKQLIAVKVLMAIMCKDGYSKYKINYLVQTPNGLDMFTSLSEMYFKSKEEYINFVANGVGGTKFKKQFIQDLIDLDKKSFCESWCWENYRAVKKSSAIRSIVFNENGLTAILKLSRYCEDDKTTNKTMTRKERKEFI